MASSIISAIPGLGDAAGSIIKGAGLLAKCEQTVKVGKAVSTTCRMIGAIAQTGVNVINFDRAFQSVRKEYRETGHVSFLNGANAVLSALGVVGGIAQSVSSIQSFDKMMRNLSSKEKLGVRYRRGQPVAATEKTLDMALGPKVYANEIVKKYGINLRGQVRISLSNTIPIYEGVYMVEQ